MQFKKKNWQTINDALNHRKERCDFSQEFQLENGTLISEPKQIANVFDTGQTNTNVGLNQYIPVKPNCNLTFRPITVAITSRIIDSLKPKTSIGVDCISTKLLKYVRNVISEQMKLIRSLLTTLNQLNIYIKGTDHVGTFMGLKCVVYYANYRSGNQSSKIQVVS